MHCQDGHRKLRKIQTYNMCQSTFYTSPRKSWLSCGNTGFKREATVSLLCWFSRSDLLSRDYIFFFGYVQLTAVEENDPMGVGNAEHLAEVNGKRCPSTSSNFLVLNGV